MTKYIDTGRYRIKKYLHYYSLEKEIYYDANSYDMFSSDGYFWEEIQQFKDLKKCKKEKYLLELKRGIVL